MIVGVTVITTKAHECQLLWDHFLRPRGPTGTIGAGSGKHILKKGEPSGPELQSQDQWRKNPSQKELTYNHSWPEREQGLSSDSELPVTEGV